MVHQTMDWFLGLTEPPHVRHVPAGLNRHNEVGGKRGRPSFEGRALRKPVEGIVHFNGGEPSAVMLEPVRRGEPRWIEAVAPVPVMPT